MAGVLIALTSTACSGRDIHPDVGMNDDVLRRQWTLRTRDFLNTTERGVEFSNPVLHENTLIFGSQNAGLVSLYPGMNQLRWVLPIPNGVISQVTVESGAAYFGGGDGFLYSVNVENGRVNWRYSVRNPVISRPVLAGGRLFVTTSDDTVYAFDAGTGQWLWHYRRRSGRTATVLGASEPLVDGDEVLAGLSDGFLVALSVQDGNLKWERKLHQGARFTDVDARPVLRDGVVYVPSYDGSLYALKRAGGDVIWRFDSGASQGVTLDGNRIYLPSSDGHVYALNAASSKVLWKFELDGGVPTGVVLTDRYAIFGSTDRYFYAVDKETGKPVYRFNAGHDSGFHAAPAFDAKKGRLYALSGGGNLYAFTLQKPPARKAERLGLEQSE